MTQGQAEREVARLQKAFELCQWDIEVRCTNAPAVDEEGAYGDIVWCPNAMTAGIHLATQRPDKDIRETILHEIFHLALVDLTEAYNKLLALVGLETAELGKATIGELNEQAVVRLGRAFTNLCAEQKGS